MKIALIFNHHLMLVLSSLWAVVWNEHFQSLAHYLWNTADQNDYPKCTLESRQVGAKEDGKVMREKINICSSEWSLF